MTAFVSNWFIFAFPFHFFITEFWYSWELIMTAFVSNWFIFAFRFHFFITEWFSGRQLLTKLKHTNFVSSLVGGLLCLFPLIVFNRGCRNHIIRLLTRQGHNLSTSSGCNPRFLIFLFSWLRLKLFLLYKSSFLFRDTKSYEKYWNCLGSVRIWNIYPIWCLIGVYIGNLQDKNTGCYAVGFSED